MTFPWHCAGCGHGEQVDWAWIGHQYRCSSCGLVGVLSAPMETAAGITGRAYRLKFACPACGRKFATKPDLAGKKIRCTRCGAGVRVPAAVIGNGSAGTPVPGMEPGRAIGTAAPGRANSPAAPEPGRASSVAAPGRANSPAAPEPAAMAPGEFAAAAEIPKAPDTEPSAFIRELASIQGARRPKRKELILPSRAELLEQIQQREVEKKAAAPEPGAEKKSKAKKAKKARPKTSTGFFDPQETLRLVAGVAVIVGVIGFLAWGYPEFRFPLGGLLCVIGFVVYLLARRRSGSLSPKKGS